MIYEPEKLCQSYVIGESVIDIFLPSEGNINRRLFPVTFETQKRTFTCRGLQPHTNSSAFCESVWDTLSNYSEWKRQDCVYGNVENSSNWSGNDL